MQIQCVQCQENFEALTKRSKYCSDKCKVAYNRGVSIATGKTPEEIRDLKYKEMQNQTNKEEIPVIKEEQDAKAIITAYEGKLKGRAKHKTASDFSGTACVCSHCGEFYGSSGGRCALYCEYCKTAPNRHEIDAVNMAIDVLNDRNCVI